MSNTPHAESAAALNPPVSKGPMRARVPVILTLFSAAALFIPLLFEELNRPLMMTMFMGPLVAFVVFLVWWLAFSGASWKVKLYGLGGIVLTGVITAVFCHPTMRFALMIYMPGLVLLFFTFTLLAFRHRPSVLPIVIPIGLLPAAFILMSLRFDGISGEFSTQLTFRWKPTPEQKFLESRIEKSDDPTKPLELATGDWPAFRGANRDGVLRGVKIRSDWNQNPPKQLWRNLIGPGWSSVAVIGNRVFTQYQADANETVVCLNLADGKEVWKHVDEVRFYEPIAGAGPRATPTFADGRLFTFGGKGVLNAFDAATGKRLWHHDLAKEHADALKEELKDLKSDLPIWGLSSSPLVFGDKVAVYIGAKDKGVAVFNVADGKEVWTKGLGGHSYTSPHFATLAGVGVILNTTNKGVQGLDPATGNELWNHERNIDDVVHCTQPTLLSGDRVAIGATFGMGTRVFNVAKSGDSFATNELATHLAFKPYFSDAVVVGDVAYGFDGAIFCCFDFKTGKKLWRGGSYGAGQVLLLADQNLLLVVSEKDGSVVLIPADPKGHKEIAKFKALTGKTWNHPVVAHGKLIVRNGEEIACFDVAEK